MLHLTCVLVLFQSLVAIRMRTTQYSYRIRRCVRLCFVGTTVVTHWPTPDDVAADNSVESVRFEMVVALSRLQQVQELQSGQ